MSAEFHAKRLFKPSSPDSAVMVRVGATAPHKREVYVQSSPDSAVLVAVPAVGRNSADYSVLDPYGRHGVPQAPPMRDLYARSVARKFPSYGAYAADDDVDLLSTAWGYKYPIYVLPDGKRVTYGRTLAQNNIFYWWDDPESGSFDRDTPFNKAELAEIKAKAVKAFQPTEQSQAQSYAKTLVTSGKAAADVASAGSAPVGAGASASGGTIPVNLVGKTWNDGSYTYEIKSETEAYVPETKVTWTPKHERWGQFVSQLKSAKNLKEGKASPMSAGSPAAVSNKPPPIGGDDPFYKKSWFIYTAAGVGVLGLAGLIIFSGGGSKKKSSQEQAA